MAFQIDQKIYPAPASLESDVLETGLPEEETAYSLEEILKEFGGKTSSSQGETVLQTMEELDEETEERVEEEPEETNKEPEEINKQAEEEMPDEKTPDGENEEADEDIKIWPETGPADIQAEESPETEEITEEAPETEEAPQAEEQPAQSPEGAAEEENASATGRIPEIILEALEQDGPETVEWQPPETKRRFQPFSSLLKRFGRTPRDASGAAASEGEAVPMPSPVPLEEIVGSTVDAVMAERYQVPWPRRTLFSRSRTEDTEAFYPPPEEPGEVIGPEPSLKTAVNVFRAEYRRRIRDLPAALLPALPPLLVLLVESAGISIPLLSGNALLRNFLLLVCLITTGWLCRQVFTAGRRCTGAFLCGVCAFACAADCLTGLFLSGRSPAEPFGAAACLALLFAKWGISMESRGQFDMFRAAALDETPPYLVTDTEQGARKQRGFIPGFYTSASAPNFSGHYQSLLLPLVLAASLVFAALSSVAQDRPADFFLNWSAILCAGATFTLPLCWGLPWARLSARLNHAGCAVAGWDGAERISRRKKMIVTDQDLFPPGSVRIHGVKIFNEDVEKVVSYAASVIRASGCGLEKVFDDLCRSELGQYFSVEDFQFYQEGGFSAIVCGEKVLLGTESFLLKMGLRLPEHPRLSTGIFISIEGEAAGMFVVHYEAAENVDFALRLMRRGHVTAILASRDPNVTPRLLQKKFHRRVKVEFPSLATRIALSKTSRKREIPRALLLREGLLPYAEAVVGSRRLCRGVRRATILSLFGSAAGTLLAFYLLFEARYNLLTPLTLILFLFLWMIPALLMMELM